MQGTSSDGRSTRHPEASLGSRRLYSFPNEITVLFLGTIKVGPRCCDRTAEKGAIYLSPFWVGSVASKAKKAPLSSKKRNKSAGSNLANRIGVTVTTLSRCQFPR